MPDDSNENEDFWDTGPFCRHFGDPVDCDEPCERCGHKCHEHGAGVDNDEPCSQEGCDCPGWVGAV